MKRLPYLRQINEAKDESGSVVSVIGGLRKQKTFEIKLIKQLDDNELKNAGHKDIGEIVYLAEITSGSKKGEQVEVVKYVDIKSKYWGEIIVFLN